MEINFCGVGAFKAAFGSFFRFLHFLHSNKPEVGFQGVYFEEESVGIPFHWCACALENILLVCMHVFVPKRRFFSISAAFYKDEPEVQFSNE